MRTHLIHLAIWPLFIMLLIATKPRSIAPTGSSTGAAVSLDLVDYIEPRPSGAGDL